MAIRKIRTDGDEILKKRSREVSEINERIITMLKDIINPTIVAIKAYSSLPNLLSNEWIIPTNIPRPVIFRIKSISMVLLLYK